MGNISAAVALYQRSLRLSPHKPHPHAELGRLYARSGDFTRARAAFAHGAEMAEPNAPLLNVSKRKLQYVGSLASEVSHRPAKDLSCMKQSYTHTHTHTEGTYAHIQFAMLPKQEVLDRVVAD